MPANEITVDVDVNPFLAKIASARREVQSLIQDLQQVQGSLGGGGGASLAGTPQGAQIRQNVQAASTAASAIASSGTSRTPGGATPASGQAGMVTAAQVFGGGGAACVPFKRYRVIPLPVEAVLHTPASAGCRPRPLACRIAPVRRRGVREF